MPLAARIPSQLWLVLATLIGGTFLSAIAPDFGLKDSQPAILPQMRIVLKFAVRCLD